MKNLLIISTLLLSAFSFAQSSDEWVEKAKETHKNYPKSSEYRSYLKNALKANPQNEEALYLISMNFIENKGYYYAEEYLKKLIKLDSTNPEC
ncbi:hypothetical protein [Maribacter sp. ACAM166]|uniref:hypothetical protein n=1 Tax=Maribacter sp. ACAM166 TaxID=2508996 RepID=UPI0010FDF4C9|nr:hypothetical protein [Maribacter sp. ACAM166]TLP81373.1 hypothetical protein ES765_05030 [Maribacter sp. ACAM166]